MNPPPPADPNRSTLEGILELCDNIQRSLEVSLRQPGGQTDRLVEEMRAQLNEKAPALLDQLPGLAANPEVSGLETTEIFLLALLFHHTIHGKADCLSGAELVALLCICGGDRGKMLAILSPGSPLRSGSWLLTENGPHAFDPAGTKFRLSHNSLALFWPGYATPQKPDGASSESTGSHENPSKGLGVASPQPTPYRSEEQLLWDLYSWRNLCLQRAEALFEQGKRKLSQSRRFRGLRREARSTYLNIRSRIGCTPNGRTFGMERFARRHKLNSDQLLVVTHLLFSELAEMEPFTSAVECLRLVAESRNDLFRKRLLFHKRGNLRRDNILQVEGDDLAKAMACHFSLSDWAEDQILAGVNDLPRLTEKDLDDFLRDES